MGLNGLAERYGGRPSDYVTLHRALPTDRVQFDLAVMLWASAESIMDRLHDQAQTP